VIDPTYTYFTTQKFFRVSEGETNDIKNMCDFLDTISKKPPNFHGFFVSNVNLDKYSQEKFNDSNSKSRVCICSYQDIVDNIKKISINYEGIKNL
jgi:hypothetical protein